MELSVQLAPQNSRGLKIKNPVMTASGTFGYGTEYADIIDINKLGAIVCKGTTLEPREGNLQPRLTETAAGVLNSIGFQNVGVQTLIEEKAPVWARWQVPVIVNITANNVTEFGQLAGLLNDVKGVSGVEVNISCPNLKHGGIEFGMEPESAAQVTRAVKESTSLPVIVKLSPNTHKVVEIAVAVATAGADALTLTNTMKGMAIDIFRRQPVLANVFGGLSGPAIKPVVLRIVYEVAGVVDIPLIGCGGITSANDAIEFIMAGATAVQIGTATFTNPKASIEVLKGIESFLRQEGIDKLTDLVGVARK